MTATPQHVDDLISKLLAPWSPESAPSERVPLSLALGRTLSQDILADRDGPPFNRAAMDGIAVCHSDWSAGHRGFLSTAILPAGAPSPIQYADMLEVDDTANSLPKAIEIMTGAAVPAPYDMVIPYEDTDQNSHTFAFVGSETRKPFAPGANIHPQAADFQTGSILLEAGTTIESTAIAVLASVGISSVPVTTRPRIAIISTGAELVSIDTIPLPHQIRASNLATLTAELSAWNLSPAHTAICTDDPAKLKSHLSHSLASSDIILVVGGVSKGLYDHIPDLLRQLEIETLIHGVAQRPGKPLLVSRSPKGQTLLGLPGNPVSCLVNLRRYLIPYLNPRALPRQISLTAPPKTAPINTRYIAVRLDRSNSHGTVSEGNGSGDFYHLATTDGFIQAPPKESGAATTYPFYPWGGAQ